MFRIKTGYLVSMKKALLLATAITLAFQGIANGEECLELGKFPPNCNFDGCPREINYFSIDIDSIRRMVMLSGIGVPG